MIKKISFGVVGFLFLTSPLIASAQTADASTTLQMRAQIQALLQQIHQLMQQLTQLQAAQGSGQSSSGASSQQSSCPSKRVSPGAQGADVSSLQQFLNGEGLLSSINITGFFGS